ncbi:unnamed protein product [Schistocephalus solidus]|uniref:PX domain-containing protein n=1 Tax=Schistocephalus solidus TaxID=70667 RepID=A0A183TD67_SCHSO|nr:unnamed protein product [Schistocephalus solidus]
MSRLLLEDSTCTAVYHFFLLDHANQPFAAVSHTTPRTLPPRLFCKEPRLNPHSYAALRTTFQSLYLPAYLESVNYLERKFAKDADKDDLSGRAAFEFLDNDDSNLMVDLSSFADDHDHDIDFADWSVTVPSYCRPTADRSHYPLLEVRTPRGKNFNQVPMNSSALDLSLLNFTPSRQGFYLIQSERGQGEMRMVVYKVHRKYAEFYVLEQKLLEFHGSAISVRLPPKRNLGSRAVEFLERSRPRLEKFLQCTYAPLADKVILHGPHWEGKIDRHSVRNGDDQDLRVLQNCAEPIRLLLLHKHHPSPSQTEQENVNASMSSPSYLIGQPFLRSSELLFAFLTSPMEFTNNILPEINLGKLVKSFPLLLAKEFFPQKGQFVDDFLLALRSSCLRSEPIKAQKKTPDASGTPPSQGTAISVLEHRLHSRHYWNNAGISLHQRKVQTTAYCALSGSYIGSFYDFFSYLFDSLRSPSKSSPEHPDRRRQIHWHPTPAEDTSLLLDVWLWLKRLFTSLRDCLYALWCSNTEVLDRAGQVDEVTEGDEVGWQYVANTTAAPSPFADSLTSSIPTLLRRTVINLWLRLGSRCREVFNFYMHSKLAAALRLLVQNNYMAPLLLLLRGDSARVHLPTLQTTVEWFSLTPTQSCRTCLLNFFAFSRPLCSAVCSENSLAPFCTINAVVWRRFCNCLDAEVAPGYGLK